eukprot:4273035-Amphidinium_carterae.2
MAKLYVQSTLCRASVENVVADYRRRCVSASTAGLPHRQIRYEQEVETYLRGRSKTCRRCGMIVKQSFGSWPSDII